MSADRIDPASNSAISAVERCPLQVARGWRSQGRAARIGIAVHRLILDPLRGLPAERGAIPEEEWAEAERMAAGFDRSRLPAYDETLSIEADRLPATFLGEKTYDDVLRQVAVVKVGDRILTGAWDLVAPSENGQDLVIWDLKSGHPSWKTLAAQAGWYAYLAWNVWPVFSRYLYRPVLLDGTISADLVFEQHEMPRVEAMLLARVAAAESSLVDPEPRLNAYCGDCTGRSQCPLWSKAVTVMPGPFDLTTPAAILEARERLAMIAKAVETAREEVTAALRPLLPVVVAGEEWYASTETTRYNVDKDRFHDLFYKVFGPPDNYHIWDFLKVDWQAVEQILKRCPNLRPDFEALRQPASTTERIRSRPAKQPPAQLDSGTKIDPIPCGLEGCEQTDPAHTISHHRRKDRLRWRRAPIGWRRLPNGAWRRVTEAERLLARKPRPRCPECGAIGKREKGTGTYLCPSGDGAFAR